MLKSYYFGGTTSDYLEFADAAPWNPAGAFTMYARIYPLSRTGTILSKWQASVDRSFLLNYDASAMAFNILGANGTGYGANNGRTPRLGIWQGVAAVFTGSSGTIAAYLGTDVGTAAPTAVGATTIKDSSIGVRAGNRLENVNPFHGFMRDIATWDAALTIPELAALNRGTSPLDIRRGSLSGYWPLDTRVTPLIGTNTPTRNGNVDGSEGEPFANPVGFFVVEAASGDIETEKLFVNFNGIEPTLVGPEELDAPFATIDVDTFQPSTPGSITPPFFTLGFFAGPVQPGTESPGTPVPVEPVVIFEGGLPPVVPPSLPPTIGGGSGAGGGGGTIPPVGPGVPLPPLSSGGLAGIRFYQGPPWRWVVTDLDTNTITFLDHLALDATVTYALNKGSTAKITMPSANPEVNILHTDDEPFVSEGNRLLYGFRREGGNPLWQVRFAGKILQVEDHGEVENARTVITAYDPWHLLYQRPMIDEDGEFPDKAGFFSFDDTQAGNICLIFLRNTILNNGSGLNDHGDLGIDTGSGAFPGAEPGNLPGTIWWDGEYEPTTQRDTFSQQGMMVGEVWDQQLETGSLDIVMTPIYDPVNRPGYMVDLSIFETAGSQRDDAVFAWDKPSRNLIGINALKDGTKRANTIRYYYGEGGPPSGGGIPLSYGPSITKYGETWHQQFYPGRIEVVVNALATLQLLLMEDGIKTVHVTPTPERMPFLFTEFWLGDTVPVFASSNLRQAIAGYQRIYGVVLSIDENSYEQVPQLLVSPEEA